MSSMPEPVGSGSPQYAPAIQIALSLKGQSVQTYNFDQSEILVGRDPYCHVYVDNPGVSRQHFKIDRGETGEYRVTDLGSSNGTYLNDRPVKVGTLRDGDVIQFGKYSIQVGIDELVGGDDAVRKHSAAEGATMMLSPSEVRQMVAEARGPGSQPKLTVVPRTTARIEEAPSPMTSANSNPWVLWVILGVIAAAIGVGVMLIAGR